ncbi:MAG: hypothetical protein KIT83_11310 [Bryobacterales bacterium]|nr:hypothetical protein [Bryobacterales bacterium]
MEGKILKGAVSVGAIVRQPVLQAADEAREILAKAKAESEQIRREAREEGFREGFGLWENAVKEAQQAALRYARQHQEDFLKLSVRIAEKILGDTLREDPERIVSVVLEALRNVSRERRLTIEAARGEASILERHRATLEARVGPECTLRILESNEVRSGGCLLRSELGTIDARVETQLALLEKALLEDAALTPTSDPIMPAGTSGAGHEATQ